MLGEAGEGPRDEARCRRARRSAPAALSATSWIDDGDAEGGDGEIVGAQPQRQRADERRAEPPPTPSPPSQPTTIGSSKPPKRPAARRRGQQRRGIGADGDEAGDADVEQPGLAPLQVEAEADDAVGQRRRQEEGARSRARSSISRALPNSPVGRTSSSGDQHDEGDRRRDTRRRRSGTADGLGEADDQAAERRRPGTLPMPPRIAAANSGSSRSKPI